MLWKVLTMYSCRVGSFLCPPVHSEDTCKTNVDWQSMGCRMTESCCHKWLCNTIHSGPSVGCSEPSSSSGASIEGALWQPSDQASAGMLICHTGVGDGRGRDWGDQWRAGVGDWARKDGTHQQTCTPNPTPLSSAGDACLFSDLDI